MTDFDRQVTHTAQQAMQPGWWSYAQASCAALEGGRATSAIYPGLRAAVGAVVKAAGYKPARHELTALWMPKTTGDDE